jgi:hypothetical protein
MSVINQTGFKILLPARDPNVFWSAVFEHYAADDGDTWRRLAMFVLRESGGWTMERIALALGLDRGTVCRGLQRVRSELRDRFECDPGESHGEDIDPEDGDLDTESCEPTRAVRTASASLWTLPEEAGRGHKAEVKNRA